MSSSMSDVLQNECSLRLDLKRWVILILFKYLMVEFLRTEYPDLNHNI